MKIITPLLLLIFFALPSSVLAQGGGGNPGGGGGGGNPPAGPNYRIEIPNPLRGGANDIPTLLASIINNVVLPIGSVVVVVMIIYSGFLFVTAQGSETRLATAKKSILYAVIGAAILLGATLMARAIQGTITQLGG